MHRVGPRASPGILEKENLLPLPQIKPPFLSCPAHSLVTNHLSYHSIPNMCEFLNEKLHFSCAFLSELFQGLPKQ